MGTCRSKVAQQASSEKGAGEKVQAKSNKTTARLAQASRVL